MTRNLTACIARLFTRGTKGRVAVGALVALFVFGEAACTDWTAHIACPILTRAEDSQKFYALGKMAPQISEEIVRRMSDSDYTTIGSIMAARNRNWQVGDVIIWDLPRRRFIQGGRIGSRWYVWYEQGGIAHSYHLAVFDLTEATATPISSSTRVLGKMTSVGSPRSGFKARTVPG